MPWTAIKAIASVPLFKPSAVVLTGVALVAKVLIALDYDLGWFAPWTTGLLLFWSSLAFVGFQVIYAVMAPSDIKIHKTFLEFAGANKGPLKDAAPGHDLQTIAAHLPDIEQELRDEISRLATKAPADLSGTDRTRIEFIKTTYLEPARLNYLTNEWRRDNVSRPVARWMATLLFGAGCVILLYLFLKNVLAVSRTTLREPGVGSG